MEKIEKLQEEEIEQLLNDEKKEVYDLEQLIIQGTDAKIFIEIPYPKFEIDKPVEYVPVCAMIRPLNNTEINTAQQRGIHNSNTTPNIEIVKEGLFTKGGEPFPPKLVDSMPSGVVDNICSEILKASGITINLEDNVDLAKQLMGF